MCFIRKCDRFEVIRDFRSLNNGRSSRNSSAEVEVADSTVVIQMNSEVACSRFVHRMVLQFLSFKVATCKPSCIEPCAKIFCNEAGNLRMKNVITVFPQLCFMASLCNHVHSMCAGTGVQLNSYPSCTRNFAPVPDPYPATALCMYRPYTSRSDVTLDG
jgi:hypothetical protein